MFAFAKIVSLLRAAKQELSGGFYARAALIAADLLDQLGVPGEAQKLRDEITAIGQGDTRGVAQGALGLIADVMSVGFGWATPITVSAMPGEDALQHKLAFLADKCEQPMPAKATPTDLSPEVWGVLIQAGIALLQSIWSKRHPV